MLSMAERSCDRAQMLALRASKATDRRSHIVPSYSGKVCPLGRREGPRAEDRASGDRPSFSRSQGHDAESQPDLVALWRGQDFSGRSRRLARVLAAVLANPQPHIGKVCYLTGPHSKNAQENRRRLARTIT